MSRALREHETKVKVDEVTEGQLNRVSVVGMLLCAVLAMPASAQITQLRPILRDKQSLTSDCRRWLLRREHWRVSPASLPGGIGHHRADKEEL